MAARQSVHECGGDQHDHRRSDDTGRYGQRFLPMRMFGATFVLCSNTSRFIVYWARQSLSTRACTIDAITSVEAMAVMSHTRSLIRNTALTINDNGTHKKTVARSAFQNFGSDTGAPYKRRASL